MRHFRGTSTLQQQTAELTRQEFLETCLTLHPPVFTQSVDALDFCVLPDFRSEYR